MIRAAALCAALICAWGPASAVPMAVRVIVGHHGLLGAGGSPVPAPSVDVPGTIDDTASPADPGALSLEMTGRVTATGVLDHAGYTLCSGLCTITAPLRSADIRLGAAARLTVSEPWTLPAGATLALTLSPAGAPMLQVFGTLTAPSGGATVSVSGTPPWLPLPLISAPDLAGTWPAGTLPADTALELRSSPGVDILYLIGDPQ